MAFTDARGGRPVTETANVIFNAANEANPNFWVQTEPMVKEQLEKVYKDTTGGNYMAGLPIPYASSENDEKNHMHAKL